MSKRDSHRPVYQLHKASGQARVKIDGRDHYLGPHGSPESYDQYQELITEWRIRNCDADRYTLTVDDLALLYLAHAKQHYRKAGRHTSEVHCIRSALRYLVATAGRTRVRSFGPKLLKSVRERMVSAGDCRSTINSNVGRLRRMFKWAVAEELVPVAVLTALQAVQGLQAGRCDAIDRAPVRPVPQDAIDAIRPFVSRPVWAMVQLQLLTGMRPGEVLSMRACDLNMSGRTWEFMPSSHKTEHHGRGRTIFLGPRAQEIVRQFLKSDLQGYLFSPRDAVLEYRTEKNSHRVTPSNQGNRAGLNRKQIPIRAAGLRYSRDAYRVAIQRGCERAFGMPDELRRPDQGLNELPEEKRLAERNRRRKLAAEWRAQHCWHPHQLRHNAATVLRREASLEVARCVLGHSSVDMAALYAEMDQGKAREAIGRLG
jgi:integrase